MNATLVRVRKLLAEAMELLESAEHPVAREIVEPMPLTAAPEMGFTQSMDVGYDWYLQLMGGVAPALLSWQREYSYIGARSPQERAKVAESMRGDTWVQANRRRATPAHVVRYWHDYLGGPRSRGRDPAADRAALELSHQRRRDELRLRYIKLKSAAPDQHARDMLDHEYTGKANRLESLLSSERT